MVKLFDTNNPLVLILLLIVEGIFWINAFMHPVLISPSTHQLISPFAHLLICSSAHQFIIIFAFLLLFIEAFILNQLIMQNKLFAKNTYLPALVYILLMSSFDSLQTLTPVIISNLFLLITLQKIFDIYDEEKPFAQIFNIGFLTSIASLFYFPSIYFIIVIFASFIIYRIYGIREWFISFLALITPYLFIAVWLFWSDMFYIVFNQYYNYFIEFVVRSSVHQLISSSAHYSLFTILYSLILGFLTVSSLIKLFSRNREKLIKTRSSYQVLLWFLLISIFVFFIGSDKHTSFFEIAFIPLSVFLSNYFQSLKKTFNREFTFIIFLILIIASKYYF